MKTATLLTLASLLPLQTNEPRDDRVLPQKLRSLPVGMLVLHHPNPVFAVKDGDLYAWRHDTTVQSLVGDLTLVEYGAYLHSANGWRLRAAMTPADFAQTYRCPGARIRKEKTYTDPDNSRRGDRPIPGDALWYFLAKDAKGRVYKGIALVETEGVSP